MTTLSKKMSFPTPAEPNERRSLIQTLNLKKAAGPNSITTKLLKVFDKTLSVPLANLINLSFEIGIFLKFLKIESVIPIFKKGDYLSCSNYRSISLTSNISKLIEKLIWTRLY